MDSTIETIYARRSVKSFDSSHEMTSQEFQKICQAAMQAPTSFNAQHWRFIHLKDPELRKKVRELGFNQAQITEASALILLAADTKAWNKNPERYWRDAPEEVAEVILGMLGKFHEGREWLQRDEAQRSIGMAAQTIMLCAKAMGYDSCPMIGFDIEEVGKLVNLPEDHVLGPLIAIGKAKAPARPKPGQLGYNEVVFENSF